MYSLEKKRRRKKIIEVTLIVMIISWILLFLIDYFRYEKSKPPIIVIKEKNNKYSDGSVDEYYSLGYVYREYKRRSIGDTEMVPFWRKMNEPKPIDGFPVTYKDYNVPENDLRKPKFKSLLYFYNDDQLLGTYKCLNTDRDCSLPISGVDEYNIQALDIVNNPSKLPEFYVVDNKYAIIDDSFYQPNATKKQYKKTIYIFDIAHNKIIGQYADVKYSVIDPESGYANGVANNIIVMNSNKKWGIINIAKNKVTEVIPFDYDSINYNTNTGHYVIHKDGWYILRDLKSKELSTKFNDPIINMIYDHDNLIVQTAKVTESGVQYKVLFADGITEIISNTENSIIQISMYNNFMIYVNNNKKLYIVDYDNKNLTKDVDIKVYFDTFNKTAEELPAYQTRYLDKEETTLELTIPRAKVVTAAYDTYNFDTQTWKLLSSQFPQ